MSGYVDIIVNRLSIVGGATYDLSDLAQRAAYRRSKEKNPVQTLNAAKVARGMTSGPEAVEGSLTIAVPKGKMLPDFHAMYENDTQFVLHCTRVGSGTRLLVSGCEISSVEEEKEAGDAGPLTMDIDWTGIKGTNKN